MYVKRKHTITSSFTFTKGAKIDSLVLTKYKVSMRVFEK